MTVKQYLSKKITAKDLGCIVALPEVVGVFTPDGKYYIGDEVTAKYLIETCGIVPMPITKDSKICSIGFCEKESGWFGWVQNVRFCFRIGSKVCKGDAAYIPDSKRNFIEQCLALHNLPGWCVYAKNITDGGFTVVRETANASRKNKVRYTTDYMFPEKFGRGEWEAKTLEDAKQMAIDFVTNVSSL